MEQTYSDQKGGRRGTWWKEEEGTSQKTCMNDSQTWKTVWELTARAGGGMGRRWQRGKIGTTVI